MGDMQPLPLPRTELTAKRRRLVLVDHCAFRAGAGARAEGNWPRAASCGEACLLGCSPAGGMVWRGNPKKMAILDVVKN
jgi:hypothetical protein